MRTCDDSPRRESLRRLPATLVFAISAAAVGGFAVADGEGAVEEILADIDPSSQRSVREGVERLHALGTPALPMLFAELGRDDRQEGGEVDRVALGVARAALARFPGAELRAFLGRGTDELALDERRGAVVHLGEMGGASELRTMQVVAAPAASALAPVLRESLARLLARNPGIFGDLWSVFGETPDAVLPHLIDALAEVGRTPCLIALSALLDAPDRVSGTRVLDAMVAIASRAAPPFDERARKLVFRMLSHKDAPTLAAAARAAGRLEDFNAATRLVELLEHDDTSVRRDSLAALRYMTGLSLRNDQLGWRTWLANEQHWWRDEAPALLRDLAGNDLVRVFSAVNALVSRRMFRNELAAELQPLLFDSDPVLRGLACTALGQIGTTRPVSSPFLALIERLDDREESVRASAWAALRLATGLDLPLSYEAWSSALHADA